MGWRAPVLALTGVLLAWPLAAQTTPGSDPGFSGRVERSPVPSRKSPPRTGAPAERDAGTRAGTGGGRVSPRPADRRPESAATVPGDDASRVTSPEGATIETRTLPVLRRAEERTPDGGADDAGGRIKAAPDPDAGPEDGDDPAGRDNSRFVRAPEGKTYEIEVSFPGFKPTKLKRTIESAQTEPWPIALEPLTKTETTAPRSPAPRPRTGTRPRHPGVSRPVAT